jgi:hypothetical protein
MKKQFALLILIALAFQSCKNNNDKIQDSTDNIVLKREDTIFENKGKFTADTIYNSKFIDIENVLINDHKAIVSKNEFDAIYPKSDSVKTTLWECGSPFEWLDKAWMIKTYGPENKEKGTFERFNGEITTIYEKGIQFTTNNHIVLFDKALASKTTFKIRNYKVKLDKNTTLKEFKKIFPNTEIEGLENKNEVRARFYLEKDSDDAFLFYFKDGKLDYFTLWWLLC